MTKADKLLIIFVVVLVIISMAFIKKQGINANDKYVSIQVAGEEIKKVIFDKKIIGKRIPIETEYGYNLIEIGDESVRVVEASCPDKLDVLQGTISEVGEAIVCLPNRLVVEIKGKSEKDSVDIINR